ncbi:complement C1q tumor necrosis factor-related protein 2-like [Mercenaria mercenaria]|uniref:complement C1q tumor necrosis factor-related protein 2-like n=1 Tax=Mercenaria mercenaria TaxID=6596 RepID=UPI00234E965B|nr:complement C1q tumor necrosis factor-related protein 2-like [Mercenaria mercenaria]
MASERITKTTRLSKRGNERGIVKSRQRRVPEIVSFTAYLSQRIDHMGVGHHVVFDKILTNDGAGYNSNTGIFTVPDTGLYLFTYSVNDHFDRSMLQLVVDGSNLVDIIVDPDSSTEEAMSGNTAIIHVSQGQSVWIQEYHIHDGSIWSDNTGRYCKFSGGLLY